MSLSRLTSGPTDYPTSINRRRVPSAVPTGRPAVNACRRRLSAAGNPRGITVDGEEPQRIPALAASSTDPRGTGVDCLARQRRVCRVTQRTRGRRVLVWRDIDHRGDVGCGRACHDGPQGRKAALFVARVLSRVALASATSCLRFSSSRCGASSASSLMASRIALRARAFNAFDIRIS